MTSIKGRYAQIEISLDKAESGKELHITGDYLTIISITGEGTCEIKIDHRHSQTIDFREILGITGPFERLYFTSDGGGGTCSIFVGVGIAIHVTPDAEKTWGSGLFSERVITSDSVQRFYATPLRLRYLKIYNGSPTQAVYLGKYNSSASTFSSEALVIGSYDIIDFKHVDLYELGFRHFTGATPFALHVFGSNEY
jgi:hypothetical protein